MVFVDFEDAPSTESIVDLYNLFLPAASEWYGNASSGRLKLNVATDMSRFYRMPRNASTYGFRRGMGYPKHRNYVQDTLDVIGHGVKFAGTDLLYIVPTREAAAISYSPTFMAPIEAHDGTVISKTVTFGQDAHYFGYKVMNHETGHTMGLPDLYSFEPRTRPGVYVGGYDLMADIRGISPDFLVWHKWRLGWLDDDQVICLGPDAERSKSGRQWTVVLTPVEEPDGVKGMVVRHNATLALVAENRSGRGLNNDTCGTGVLIYTVSTTAESGHGPVRVQDSSPDSEACGGEKLNNALFVPGHINRSSFVSEEFGVHIKVLKEIERGFVIKVSLL
jgi:M6 family metalloprotease-like protein